MKLKAKDFLHIPDDLTLGDVERLVSNGQKVISPALVSILFLFLNAGVTKENICSLLKN